MKYLPIAQVGGRLPHARHDLRRLRHRVRLLIDLQILVADHVEQHAEDRPVVRRRAVIREILRAEQHVVRYGAGAVRTVVIEAALVLAVDEQQIDADDGGVFLNTSASAMNSATPDAPSLAPGIGRPLVAEVRILVGSRTRVPVRDVEDALRRRRVEPREDVAQRQLVAASRSCVQLCTITLSARFFIWAMIQSPVLRAAAVPGTRGPKSSCAFT